VHAVESATMTPTARGHASAKHHVSDRSRIPEELHELTFQR
jgi:hypothetical protein